MSSQANYSVFPPRFVEPSAEDSYQYALARRCAHAINHHNLIQCATPGLVNDDGSAECKAEWEDYIAHMAEESVSTLKGLQAEVAKEIWAELIFALDFDCFSIVRVAFPDEPKGKSVEDDRSSMFRDGLFWELQGEGEMILDVARNYADTYRIHLRYGVAPGGMIVGWKSTGDQCDLPDFMGIIGKATGVAEEFQKLWAKLTVLPPERSFVFSTFNL